MDELVRSILLKCSILCIPLIAAISVILPKCPPLPQLLGYALPILCISSLATLEDKEIAEDNENEDRQKIEILDSKSAIMFPFIASAGLFGIYILLKVVPKDLFNTVMSIYVVLSGTYSCAELFKLCISTFNKSFGTNSLIDITINIPWPMSSIFSMKTSVIQLFVSRLTALSHVLAVAVSLGWAFTNQWTLSNLLAVSFSIMFIKYVSAGSFKIVFLLLTGLFFYDIFWVFGTDVMLTVATKFQIPAKLTLVTSTNPWKTGLLGLGDIVLPGLLISMCLRFDWHRNGKVSKFFPTFFICSLVAYAVGLIVTSIVMAIYKQGQPALLYLVPAGFIGTIGPAVLTGSLKELWQYSEEEEKSESDDSDSDEISDESSFDESEDITADSLTEVEMEEINKSSCLKHRNTANQIRQRVI